MIIKEYTSPDGRITLINADCMDVMDGMKEKEFELAIVDFPYGISVNMNAGRKSDAKSKKRTLKKWDSELPYQETFNNLFYVSKNQIIWGANHMIDRIRRNSQGWIFWDKCVAAGCTFSDGELAWTSFDRSLKKAVVPWSGFIGYEGEKFHPTTKPVALYSWILKNYAKPNDTILDTHAGSMSIAIAVHKANTLDNMNLKLTCIELDTEYYEKAVNRFKNYINQQTINF